MGLTYVKVGIANAARPKKRRDVKFLDRLSRQAARMTVDWGQTPRVELRLIEVR